MFSICMRTWFSSTGSRKSQEKSFGNKVLCAKRSPVSDGGRGLKPAGSVVSSALIAGDQRARVSVLFCQASWVSNAWLDTLNGPASTAKYDDRAKPLLVTNRGAETERWLILINGNGTTYNVIGEHVGQIVTNWPLGQDCSPINPASGTPYWTLYAAGMGQGWLRRACACGNWLCRRGQ